MRPADQEENETRRRLPFADTCRIGTLFVAALAIPLGARAETRITPTASVEGTFTDNVRSSLDGTEESDLLTTPTVGVGIQNTSARTSLNLSYNLSADRYKDAQDLNEERHQMTGVGNVEIIRDMVDVGVQTSLSRRTIDRGGAVSGVDRNLGANQTDTLVYGITPRYRTNFSNWGVSNLQYGFNQTVFDPFGNQSGSEDTSNDATTNDVSYNLSSGRLFSRIGWALNAAYSRTSEDGGDTTSSATSDVTVSYQVNRFFRPRTSIGYDRFRGSGNANSSNANNNDGLTWAVGTVLTPGPRTSIDVEYGRDYEDNHIQGNASFQITPTMRLTATATHQFAVTQQQIANSLNNLTVDQNGNFIDSATGLPFTGSSLGSDLSEVNNVTRTQTYTLSLNGSRGRNTYGVVSSLREEENSLSGRQTTTLTSSANFGRNLTPHLSASLSAQLSGTDENTSDDVRTANLTAGLSYQLGENVSGAANYTFTQTDSSGTGGDRMENTITARLQISF